MAKDWASDVKKYVPDADDAIIAGIVRYCGIALQKVDSSLVSFSDPTELARVRNNFLKKKCGLTDSDDVLDAAIAKVGERMKADRTKNRVTVYYLLADHFGILGLFQKAVKSAAGAGAAGAAAAVLAAAATAAPAKAARAKPKAKAASAGAAVAGGAGEAAADTITPVASAPLAFSAAAPTPAAAAAGVTATGAGLAALGHWDGNGPSPLGRKLNLGGSSDGSGAGLLWFAVVAAVAFALFLLAGMLTSRDASTSPAASADAVSAAPVVADTPVAPPVVPTGAGVTSETRDGKPLVKVYFDTNKAEVVPAFAPATDALRSYLTANPGSKLGISGYNDPTGNAAANAELSKRRAQAVQATLIEAGIPEASIELVKPETATDATAAKADARRVEVFVK